MKADVELEVGKDAGDRLLSSMRGAREEIMITSPWLSRSTAELATKKQEQGVDVEVITTAENSGWHLRALRALVEVAQREVRSRRPRLLAGGLLTILAGLLTPFLFQSAVALLAAVSLVVSGATAAQLGREKTESFWQPKVESLSVFGQDPLLHAKIYVMDDEVAIGSANFTVTGLNRSVEALAFLSGPEIAGETRSELEEGIREGNLTEFPLETVLGNPES